MKRILTFLLALLMVVTMIPMSSYAVSGNDMPDNAVESETKEIKEDKEADKAMPVKKMAKALVQQDEEHPDTHRMVKFAKTWPWAYKSVDNYNDGKQLDITKFPTEMRVAEVYVLSDNTKMYKLETGDGSAWPEVYEGYYYIDSSKMAFLVWCESCEQYDCGVDHTKPELKEDTAESQGSVSGATASGIMSSDAVLTVNEGNVSVNEEVSGNMIDLMGDALSAMYKGYVFDIDLSGQYEGGITITIPASQMPVIGDNEQIRIVHLLDSAEAVQNAKNRGTAIAYSEDGLGDKFPEEVAASGENNTLYYEEISAERDSDGNVVFTTYSFSTFNAYTITFNYKGAEIGKIDGERRILLSNVLGMNGILSSGQQVSDILRKLSSIEFSPDKLWLENAYPAVLQYVYLEAHQVNDYYDYSLIFRRPFIGDPNTTMTVRLTDGTTIQITLIPNNITYYVNYDPGVGKYGPEGQIPNQTFTYGQIGNLSKNTYLPPDPTKKITYNLNITNDYQINQAIQGYDDLKFKFNGWEDHGKITYVMDRDNGSSVTYTYDQFDAPYYANPYVNGTMAFAVYYNYEYTAGRFDKYGIAMHYTLHGKPAGLRGTPDTSKGELPGVYFDKAPVANLATEAGYTVPLVAQWGLDKVTLPNPTRKGYTFKGWYTAAQGGNLIGAGGTDYQPLVNEDIQAYAQWEPVEYTITYDLDGGQLANGDTNPAKYTIEDTPITLKNPSKAGYSFDGWRDKENGTVSKTMTIAKGSIGAKEFTALWTENEASLVYKVVGEGGKLQKSSESITSKEITQNVKVLNGDPSEVTAVPDTGYHFLGWYSDENCTNRLTTETTYKPSKTNGEWQSATYYAKFEIDMHTVTVTYDDKQVKVKQGSNCLDGFEKKDNKWQKVFEYGSQLTLDFVPLTGYKISGITIESGGTLVEKVDSGTVEKTIDKDMDFVVQSAPIAYTIRFNKNADKATGTMNNMSMTYGDKKNLTANQFVCEGYTFRGWAETSDGTVKYQDKQEVAKLTDVDGTIIDLYAVWELNTFSLTIVTNNTVDTEQTYLITVNGSTVDQEEIKLVIAMNAQDSKTISDLPAGEYTVSDQENWSWRYNKQSQSVTFLNKEPSSQTVTFDYIVKRNPYWLNGFSNIVRKEN